jgi:hypothetical protein
MTPLREPFVASLSNRERRACLAAKALLLNKGEEKHGP